MKFAGSVDLGVPREELWRALEDPKLLSQSLPGLTRLEVVEPDRYDVTLKVGVGSITGTYDGTFAITDRDDGRSCNVEAKAQGAQGSLEALARVTLTDREAGGTTVGYEADATIAGPVAGVGQRMIGAAVKRTTRDFFGALEQALVDPSIPAEEVAPATAEPSAAAASVYVRPARAGGLHGPSIVLGFALALAAAVLGNWILA